MNYRVQELETPSTTVYEGACMQAKVVHSNRTSVLIEWTGVGDRVIIQHTNVEDCINRLEAGENPDIVFDTRRSKAKSTKKLHAEFWHYDEPRLNGEDQSFYDPHGFGLALISEMAYVARDWIQWSQPNTEVGRLVSESGVCLKSVILREGKTDGLGHKIRIAATADQWEAVRQALISFNENEVPAT